MNKFISAVKNFGREAYYFVSSKIFLKNFGTLAGGTFVVLYLIFWWFGCYTQHGQSVTVPNVVDMPLDQATEGLGDKHLSLVVSDSIYVSGKKGGYIISQEPTADEKVKYYRKVYVTISAFRPQPKETNATDFIDKDISEVRRKCAIWKCKLEEVGIPGDQNYKGVVQEVRVDNQVVFKYVNGKRPDAANKFKFTEETKFVVYYIEGGGTEVSDYNVVCMGLDEAKFQLANSELNIGAIVPDASVPDGDSSNLYIWKQTPDFELDIPMHKGEEVTLFVHKGMPTDCQ